MTVFAFKQLDVFATQPLQGNPLAVVLGADALADAQLAALARWTNLSETAFLLAPTTTDADYRVRIFTTTGELPFAGHPTLGSCHAWLEAGGQPRGSEIVQECGVGLVRIRRDGPRLAFAAPPLGRQGPIDGALLDRTVNGLGIHVDDVRAAEWIDNGPGWFALLMEDRAAVLSVQPDYAQLQGLKIGLVAPWQPGEGAGEPHPADIEVRAFIAGDGMQEDPVTGSLNAGIAQWLIGSDRLPGRDVASQGTALGRSGRVHVEAIGDDVWIGGDTVTCIDGTITL